MARKNRFVILMNEQEREAVEQLAKRERLPASTFARRRLLQEAEQRGIASTDAGKTSNEPTTE